MNILLSAVGRRAYLVEYFQNIVHPLGGKVYATNTIPDATGFIVADEARVVPASASEGYVDQMVSLCREWRIKLLFSLHDWDAPVIARARQRFLEVGTIPVMGSSSLMATCLDKYAAIGVMESIGIKSPRTVLSVEDAIKDLSFPMVVKPRWGQGSLGLFTVRNEDELRAAFYLSTIEANRFADVCHEMDALEPQVIIQECVSGEEYGCDIVNDLNGRFRKAFVKHKFAMRSGETDAAESVLCPQIETAAARVGEWSKHLGCMDSDWIIGADGVPVLIELNPRFGGGYPFTYCAGANVPLACVNWALGKDDDVWCQGFRPGIRIFKEISMMMQNA